MLTGAYSRALISLIAAVPGPAHAAGRDPANLVMVVGVVLLLGLILCQKPLSRIRRYNALGCLVWLALGLIAYRPLRYVWREFTKERPSEEIVESKALWDEAHAAHDDGSNEPPAIIGKVVVFDAPEAEQDRDNHILNALGGPICDWHGYQPDFIPGKGCQRDPPSEPAGEFFNLWARSPSEMHAIRTIVFLIDKRYSAATYQYSGPRTDLKTGIASPGLGEVGLMEVHVRVIDRRTHRFTGEKIFRYDERQLPPSYTPTSTAFYPVDEVVNYVIGLPRHQ